MPYKDIEEQREASRAGMRFHRALKKWQWWRFRFMESYLRRKGLLEDFEKWMKEVEEERAKLFTEEEWDRLAENLRTIVSGERIRKRPIDDLIAEKIRKRR